MYYEMRGSRGQAESAKQPGGWLQEGERIQEGGRKQASGWVQESGCQDAPDEKVPVARSVFMQVDEIDREREKSGWNPYAGEEILAPGDNVREDKILGSGDDTEKESVGLDDVFRGDRVSGSENDVRKESVGLDDTFRGNRVPGSENDAGKAFADPEDDAGMRPCFMQRDYAGILQEEQERERELRKLQAMYPEAAKLMLPYVEEACDKMEYEGSPMFDEYPDRTTVYRVEEQIYGQVRDRFPEEAVQEPEEVLSMQYPGPGGGNVGKSWVRDLARVLLLQEMHHRRCRYRNCRKKRV